MSELDKYFDEILRFDEAVTLAREKEKEQKSK